jgi:predicted acetyltransferase
VTVTVDIRLVARDRLFELIGPISTAFGLGMTEDRAARFGSVPELDLLIGACEGEAIVGSAAAFSFDMTVPGGTAVRTAGLTIVAVLPTHRRRGILRQLMRRHLDEARRRGQAIAALYASEGGIYGRFGYGMAALRGEIDLSRDRTAFVAGGAVPGDVRVRLVGEEEAALVCARIWERVRPTRPGMLSRSDTWWRVRRVSDPEPPHAGRPPLQRALVEIDGQAAAYALYRLGASMSAQSRDVPLDVVEALGDSPAATRALWRYLFDIDLVRSFRATHLPPDHPLVFLLADPARLRLCLGDGLWVRLVDVGAALSLRRYGEGPPVVIEVDDRFCPWNTGRYLLGGAGVERTPLDAEPELTLDVDALGAVYLGGFGVGALARAGRVVERAPGALRRADALLRCDLHPWCPEMF